MVAIINFAVMTQSTLCYFNGEFIPYDKIRIPVSDLQLQRGYGIFDFFRTRKGQIPWLNDYLQRLSNSIRLSGIETDMDVDQLKPIIHELQVSNGMENGAFKIIVTGGYSDNLETANGKANIMILNVPWNPPPPESFEKGVNLICENYIRPNPEVKTLYYFNTLRLQKKLKQYQAVDVLYHNGIISEASRASIFFVKSDQVFTPASNILEGITRKRLLSQFSDIRTVEIESGQLYDFDEAFISSTSRNVTPVVSIEGKKIGAGKPGPLTRKIQAEFI